MNCLRNLVLCVLLAAAVPLATPRTASAQLSAVEIAANREASNAAPNTTPKPDTPKASPHRFWDRTNDLLFAGVAASRALDYSSTLNMRRRGRQEILLTNDVVDNHPAFAAIEVAGTGVSIGASYLFHRYGHHKLERWTSVVHASIATSGAIRNYCLKTAHPAPVP